MKSTGVRLQYRFGDESQRGAGIDNPLFDLLSALAAAGSIQQAAKDLKVKVTFEGPETEAMVDKQIDMLSAALAKKPQAIGFAATGGGVGAFLFPFLMSALAQGWGIRAGFATYAVFGVVMTAAAIGLSLSFARHQGKAATAQAV